METPPWPLYKKRVFSNRISSSSSSSSSLMDPDVIEIAAPLVSCNRKLMKEKQAILHEVIDVDEDEDSADVVVINKKIDASHKGKAIECVSNALSDHQIKGNNIYGSTGVVETLESINGYDLTMSIAPALHNSSSVDASPDDDDDDYIDFGADDEMGFDEYAILQAHFDSMDIPPGVEAPIPWLTDHTQRQKKPANGSSSSNTRSQMDLKSVVPCHGLPDPYPSFWSPEFAGSSMTSSSMSNSSMGFQTQLDSVSHDPGLGMSSCMLPPHYSQTKRKFTALQHEGSPLSLSSKSQQPFRPLKTKKRLGASSLTNFNSLNQFSKKKIPMGVEPYFWGPHIPDSIEKQDVRSKIINSSSPAPMGTPNYPPEPYMASFFKPPKYELEPFYINQTTYPSFYDPFNDVHILPEEAEIPLVPDSSLYQNSVVAGGSLATPSASNSSSDRNVLTDDTLRKFQLFKQFDTVEDNSDHHYARHKPSGKQPSKNWAKKIQDEWKILEKGLPDTIFVRIYESRMDLLRAVIVGAEGTPYHDGLFFFDVRFPSGYPNIPPKVYYHSGGLRLNPNLYACGKVCLSLLNTWSGNKNEKWIPGVSTMLQLLVSIQGLILNTKPYFNEPGYANLNGSVSGEMMSQKYNETTFILSLKTMSYTMRRPPKHFEDFVVGHFCTRANDILVSCKAYMDGAQVGCLVKGGVQDVDEGDKSCSQQFKDNLAGYFNILVEDFMNKGAKDCQKFLSQTNVGTNDVSIVPKSAPMIFQ